MWSLPTHRRPLWLKGGCYCLYNYPFPLNVLIKSLEFSLILSAKAIFFPDQRLNFSHHSQSLTPTCLALHLSRDMQILNFHFHIFLKGFHFPKIPLLTCIEGTTRERAKHDLLLMQGKTEVSMGQHF